jgi:hypothetical protein
LNFSLHITSKSLVINETSGKIKNKVRGEEGCYMRLHRLFTFVVLMGLIISGCQMPNNQQPGIKVNAAFTAAAQTLEAKLTQAPPSNQVVNPTTSISATNPLPNVVDISTQPTGTPALTATVGMTATLNPTATDVATEPVKICDAAQFIRDVTIPDKTVLNSGEPFTKTWRLKNIGTCAWNSSYSLVFDVGDQMGDLVSAPLSVSVAPGQEVDLSVNLQAPAEVGSYRSYWRLRNPDGLMLTVENGYKSKSFYVDIEVKNKNGSSSKDFAISSVEFAVTHSGSCSSGIYTVAATIRANGAGEISYSWKRSDGTNDPASDGNLTFAAAGTQIIRYDWASGATGLSMTLSIDRPKQQEFGPALLNCS